MSFRLHEGLISGLTLGLVASVSQAGVVITTLQEDLVSGSAPQRIEMALEKDRLRLDVQGSGDAKGAKGAKGAQAATNMVLIYRKDKDAFWMIRPAEKAYTELTSKDLEQIANTLDAARAKMQEQLKNLPPEQRAMMEKMMGGLMGGIGGEQAQPKLSFKKASGSGKVGAYACENWESFLDGVKSAEHCVADFKATDITVSDFDILKDMSTFIGKLAPQYKGLLDQSMNLEQMGGVPVSTTVISEGKAESRITLQTIKREKTDAARFELPAGYKKAPMPMGALGGK